MMLLVSPFVLLAIGVLVARVSKARRVWRRHSLFTLKTGLVLLILYSLFSLGLLFDVPSLRPLVAGVGAETGTALFVGSGLGDTDAVWPLTDARLMALIIVSFMLYPFWFWLGVQAGYWAFGRSPKQTGILGLLR